MAAHIFEVFFFYYLKSNTDLATVYGSQSQTSFT